MSATMAMATIHCQPSCCTIICCNCCSFSTFQAMAATCDGNFLKRSYVQELEESCKTGPSKLQNGIERMHMRLQSALGNPERAHEVLEQRISFVEDHAVLLESQGMANIQHQ